MPLYQSPARGPWCEEKEGLREAAPSPGVTRPKSKRQSLVSKGPQTSSSQPYATRSKLAPSVFKMEIPTVKARGKKEELKLWLTLGPFQCLQNLCRAGLLQKIPGILPGVCILKGYFILLKAGKQVVWKTVVMC